MKQIILGIAILLSTTLFSQKIDEVQLKKFATIALKATTPEKPVSMNAKIFTANKATGKSYLVVKAKVHKHWHIYAYVPEGGFFITSEIKLDLPKGVTANLVKEPQTVEYDAAPQIMLYKGDLLFVYELKSNGVSNGEYEVTTTLSYQACDPYSCLPPNEIVVKNQLKINN